MSKKIKVDDDQQLLDDVIDDKESRYIFFENDFPAFFQYHFGWQDIKPFHEQWLDDFADDLDLLYVTFRASRKTTIARAYAVWCIAYAKEPYIVVQSYEDTLSSAWVRAVATMLLEPSIIRDYGYLFPFNMTRDQMKKASFSDFKSTTDVRIESKSLAQPLRGANEYQPGQHSQRPTLLFLDDIDVDKSTKNPDMIQQNYDRLKTETIGAMDPLRRRIIFLANVIRKDGIAVRFYTEYKTSKLWKVTRLFLFDGRGKTNVWPEVFTPKVIAKLKEDGSTAYKANYLGMPMADGDTIIKRSDIQYIDKAPDNMSVTGGIDPAFSTKTGTDAMTLVITGHVGKKKYVLAAYEFFGEDKNELRFCKVVVQAYPKFKISRLRVEGNNGGTIIVRMLKRENLAVEEISSDRDKETRLREHQGAFEGGDVYFLPGTEHLVEQLLDFPNGTHDDLVDGLVNSFVPPSSLIIE